MFNYDIIEGSVIVLGVLWLCLICPLIIRDIKEKGMIRNEDK